MEELEEEITGKTDSQNISQQETSPFREPANLSAVQTRSPPQSGATKLQRPLHKVHAREHLQSSYVAGASMGQSFRGQSSIGPPSLREKYELRDLTLSSRSDGVSDPFGTPLSKSAINTFQASLQSASRTTDTNDKRASENEDEMQTVTTNASTHQIHQKSQDSRSQNTEQMYSEVTSNQPGQRQNRLSDEWDYEHEVGQATPYTITTPDKARVVNISRRSSAASVVTPFAFPFKNNDSEGSFNTIKHTLPIRTSSKPISTIKSNPYGGLVNQHSPSLYSVASYAYGSSNDDRASSPEIRDSAVPSPLIVNRPIVAVKRGVPILHSASTNDLLAPRVRSQVAEPEYHPQSILAGLEKMLAQSSKQKFQLNHPMIVYMRFMLKPQDDEAKTTGRFAHFKAKFIPKRAQETTTGSSLRNTFQDGRSANYLPSFAVFDPTVDAVRKIFPEELTDNLKSFVAIIISIAYLDKLPIMDPNSPVSWSDMQLSPENVKPRDLVAFENAPAKARAMLGMEKGMKGLVMQRSASDVLSGPSRDVKPKGRDRVETIQLELKALVRQMIVDVVESAPAAEVQRLFVAASEIVRLSEGFE